MEKDEQQPGGIEATAPTSGAKDAGAGGSGMRMSAKSAIKYRIEGLRAEADSLEDLLNFLPDELPPGVDSAIWDMVGRRRW